VELEAKNTSVGRDRHVMVRGSIDYRLAGGDVRACGMQCTQRSCRVSRGETSGLPTLDKGVNPECCARRQESPRKEGYRGIKEGNIRC
jgi:hypothetical protein